MRGNYKSFKGINLAFLEIMHQFIIGGGGGAGGAAQSVCGNFTSLKGIHVTVLERMHQFIMYQVYPIINYFILCGLVYRWCNWYLVTCTLDPGGSCVRTDGCARG